MKMILGLVSMNKKCYNYGNRKECRISFMKKNPYDFGKQIEELVQNAVDTLNFDQLSNNINQMIGQCNEEVDKLTKNLNNKRKTVQYTNFPKKEGLEKKYTETKNRLYSIGNTLSEKFNDYVVQKTSLFPINKKAVPKTKGILLTVFSAIASINFTLLTIATGVFRYIEDDIPMEIVFTFGGLGVVALLVLTYGISVLKKCHRMKRYLELIEDKGYISLADLERHTCISRKLILNDIKEMLTRGVLPEGSLDRNEQYLIGSRRIYEQYEAMEKGILLKQQEERREREQEKVKCQLHEVEDGKKILNEIMDIEPSLGNEILSKKLHRFSYVSNQIFTYVEENPNMVEELYRMNSYYLPTIYKLIKSYHKIQNDHAIGNQVKTMCEQIEETIDMMNSALETLYDGLYSAEALDISSDISVLKTMLAREGLVKDEFTIEKEEIDNE